MRNSMDLNFIMNGGDDLAGRILPLPTNAAAFTEPPSPESPPQRHLAHSTSSLNQFRIVDGAISRKVPQPVNIVNGGGYGLPPRLAGPSYLSRNVAFPPAFQQAYYTPPSSNPFSSRMSDLSPLQPNAPLPGFAAPEQFAEASRRASSQSGQPNAAPPPVPQVRLPQKSHKCKTCGRCFVRKSGMIRHEKIHLGIRLNRCTVCGKKFSQRSALTVHNRVHTGEKPYSCDVCQRPFSDSSSLARHRRIHLRDTGAAATPHR